MKVKITRDNGEEKKFSCEAFVLVLQDGKRTGITVLGSADAVQWACILSGLDEAKADVVEKKSVGRISFLYFRSVPKEGGQR